MSHYQREFSLAFFALSTLVLLLLPSVSSKCNEKPVIFNFGDSNSDTGCMAAGLGYDFGYPYGRTFFDPPSGRLSDGRLIIDFMCENLTTNYLTPYLESVKPDFTNGVNFAVVGASTLPKFVPFNLNIQLLQFGRFFNRTMKFQSKGFKNLVRKEDFKNALYMFDIGQNDLTLAFGNSSISYPEVVEKIPSFISEINDAMMAIYKVGGRKFWVHNTGPLGCLTSNLALRKPNTTELDQYGCIKSVNEASKAFNAKLNSLCDELRSKMKDSTIVYVDIYSIKYDLFANFASYGFKNPLMACCGYGGPPYNFDLYIKCRDKRAYVCEQGTPFISWDGNHYAEAANSIVASKILSTKYSTPPLPFNFFINNA